MINILPSELDVIAEIYISTVEAEAKSKPDYNSLLKLLEKKKRQHLEQEVDFEGQKK